MQVTGNNPQHPHILSIRITTDGFSFYVLHSLGDTQPTVTHYPCEDKTKAAEQLQRCFEYTAGEGPFERIYVLVDSPATRIPLEHFRREEAETLYRLTFPDTTPEDKVLYNILPHVEAVELFSLPATVCTWLYQRFPDIRIYGKYSMLLEKVMRRERRLSANKHLYIYLEERQMFTCLFQEGRLAFANTYAIESPANRLYFILYVWKALGLDAEQDDCILLDSHPCKEETAEALRPYLRHVKLPARTELFPRISPAYAAALPIDVCLLLTFD